MTGNELLVLWHETVEETVDTASGPLVASPAEKKRVLAAFAAAFGGVEGIQARYEQETARKVDVARRRAKQAQAQARATASRHGRRQCIGTTTAGDRCTRLAIAGRKKCQQHLETPTLPKARRLALRHLADLRGPSGRPR